MKRYRWLGRGINSEEAVFVYVQHRSFTYCVATTGIAGVASAQIASGTSSGCSIRNDDQFATIENRVNRKGRVGGNRIFVKCEGLRSGILMKFGGVRVRF